MRSIHSKVTFLQLDRGDGTLLDQWEVARLHIGPDRVEVGMPTSYNIGSDSYGGSITEVRRKGREVVHTTERGIGKVFTWRPSRSQYVQKGGDYGYLTVGVSEQYLSPEF